MPSTSSQLKARAQKAPVLNPWLRSLQGWRWEEGQEASIPGWQEWAGNQVPTRNMCLPCNGLTPQSWKMTSSASPKSQPSHSLDALGSVRLTGSYPSPAQSAGTRRVIPPTQAKEGSLAPRARELCLKSPSLCLCGPSDSPGIHRAALCPKHLPSLPPPPPRVVRFYPRLNLPGVRRCSSLKLLN